MGKMFKYGGGVIFDVALTFSKGWFYRKEILRICFKFSWHTSTVIKKEGRWECEMKKKLLFLTPITATNHKTGLW